MTFLVRPAVALALAAGIIGAAGCSSDKSSTVTGEVLVDGKPLKEGIIRFVPADGKSQTADAPIADGKYSAKVPPGDKKVEISAPKVVGKKKMYDTPDSPVVDEIVELLPARYNTNTELTMKVENGSQEKKFELKGK